MFPSTTVAFSFHAPTIRILISIKIALSCHELAIKYSKIQNVVIFGLKLLLARLVHNTNTLIGFEGSAHLHLVFKLWCIILISFSNKLRRIALQRMLVYMHYPYTSNSSTIFVIQRLRKHPESGGHMYSGAP